MPIKNQTECYRTVKGIRWPNMCDIMTEDDELDVARFRARGGRLKVLKHPDGYKQAFAHPDDLERWNHWNAFQRPDRTIFCY